MPGAYAHITLLHRSLSHHLATGSLSATTSNALDRWRSHAELGAVSPDYPYLAGHTVWSDRMHHEATDAMLHHGLQALPQLAPAPRERATAWLMGYAAHMVADMTIHPVINALVGPYEENKAAHRSCEMHMDAMAFGQLGLGDVGLSDHLTKNLAACCAPDDPRALDPDITALWTYMLGLSHPGAAAADPPRPAQWHQGFLVVMDAIRETNRLVPFARRLGVNAHLDYPMPQSIDPRWVTRLPTPQGPMDYGPLLDLALQRIGAFWTDMDAVISGADPGRLAALSPWNLDTGLSTGPRPHLVCWPEA